MDNEPTDPQVRYMLDLPPLPKRRAGKPPTVLAPTFDEALANLKPREQQFVRHVLADKTHAEAYRLIAQKPATDRTAQVEGSKLAARHAVAHAIRLGKQAGAVQAVTGIKHDVSASFDEFGRVLDAAMAEKQYTAAARAAELRAKLFRLIDGQPQVQAQAVTFVFKRFGDETPDAVIVEGEKQ